MTMWIIGLGLLIAPTGIAGCESAEQRYRKQMEVNIVNAERNFTPRLGEGASFDAP